MSSEQDFDSSLSEYRPGIGYGEDLAMNLRQDRASALVIWTCQEDLVSAIVTVAMEIKWRQKLWCESVENM